MAEVFTTGKHTYVDGNHVQVWGDTGKVTVGSFCSIARNVSFFLNADHNIKHLSTYPFNVLWDDSIITDHPTGHGDITIGNDVWIGMNTVIMSGVTIGDGAVIGANSVVRTSVEPYAVYYGNPAEFKKNRFSYEVTEKLLELQWWDLEDVEIAKLAPYLQSENIDRLLGVICTQ